MPNPKRPRTATKLGILVAVILIVTVGLYWMLHLSGPSITPQARASENTPGQKPGGNQPDIPQSKSAASHTPAAGPSPSSSGGNATTTTATAIAGPGVKAPASSSPASSNLEEPEAEIDYATHYVIINGQHAHPSRLLAKYKSEKPDPTRQTLLERFELRAKNAFSLTPKLVMLKSTKSLPPAVANEEEAKARGEEMQERIKALMSTGQFQYVEPDYIQSIDATPTDQAFTDGTLWGLRNTGQSNGVVGADIDAVRAWDTTTGSTDVIVAVIDTGIRYTHQDLAAQMWRNPGEIAGNGIDDDNDGYVDNVFGINAVTNSGDPMDDYGHGTHCAGTIGASAGSGGQHVGVAWQVRLMACRFMAPTSDGRASGSTSDAIKCINFSVTKGARILSNSWGGGAFSQALSDAISAAKDAGVLFVAAAGNSATNTDSYPSYPASYTVDNIISVAALDRQDKLASFSNYGLVSVDIGAPGVSIFSCTNTSDTSYETWSGTSMAGPHVAGVAALVLAHFPDLSVSELRQRVLAGAVPIPALTGKASTGGRLNAYNSLHGEPDGTLEVAVSPATGTELMGGTNVSFFVSVRDFLGVENATVTGIVAGNPNVIFTNNGVAPDTRANDNIYSASISIPSSASTFSMQIEVTAPDKTSSTIPCTYTVLLPPPNNNFASRIAIEGTVTTVTGSNLIASKETGEPNHAGLSGGKSVWWSWTAPANGTVTISTDGSTFDTVLGVYTGTAVNNLTTIASDNDSGAWLNSLVSFPVTAGTTYQIAVDGVSGASGNITLNTTFIPTPVPPANDNFSSASTVTGINVTDTGTNQGATKEAGEPNHAGNTGGRSVWWTWTAPVSGTATVSTDGSLFDTTLGVYIGTSVSSLTTIASDNDTGDGSRSQVNFSASAGTTYRIAVDGYNGTAGSIALSISLVVAPPTPVNDNFADRTALTGTNTIATGTNVGASKETTEPDHAQNSGGKSVWWTWTAPSTGTVTITTANSNFDTLLAVYTGSSLSGLTLIASNDQDPFGGSTSRVICNVTAGTPYQIAVDGVNSGLNIALGSITLNITLSASNLPPNDLFALRTPVTSERATMTGSNVGATRETGEPDHYGSAYKSVWWSWTASTTGTAIINTDGSPFDTVLAIYTGTELTSLSLIGRDDDSGMGTDSQITFVATAGTTYQIAVDGLSGSSGSITLNINPIIPPPVITSNPSSQSRYIGDAISLYVSATSSTPMSYQWKKDGVDLVDNTHISGATGSSLYIGGSLIGDSGQYTVVVTNSSGSTTSAAATITVSTPPPPVINTQPLSQSVYLGNPIYLSVGVSNTGTTTYQWQKSIDNGATFTNIPYATSSSLSIYTSQAGDAGQYRVLITNPGGSTTSNAATIIISIPPGPVITTQPTNQSIYLGESIFFNVSVTSNGPTTYQWQKSTDNGATFTNIPYAIYSYYNIYTSQASDAGQYRVVVTNSGGSITSNVATVTFLTQLPPVITAQPISRIIYLGDSTYLSVSISNTGPTTYQWQKSIDNGVTFTNILYETSSSFNIYNSRASDAGLYRVVVTNSGGSTTSNVATITFLIPPPPVITTQPTDRSIYVGTSFSLSVSVSTLGTTTYQWQKSTDNGVTFTNIVGALSSYFSIYTSQANDTGQYRIIVTNSGGTTTSNVATITVTIPPVPVITTQPLSQSIYPGDSFYLNISASNTGQTTYQWQKSADNGVTFTNILYATSSSFNIYTSQISDAGQYRVVVTNPGGSTTSNVATVSFLMPPPPVITTQPISQSVYLGVSINLGISVSITGTTTYQWQKSTDNGITFTNITGSTNSSFGISRSQVFDAGQYRVIVTNAGGFTISNVATVTITVPPAPVITTQPLSQSVYLGDSVYFNVSASNTGQTTYKWQKSIDNGTIFIDISGASDSSFSIYTSRASDAGQYRVIVTNPGGSTTSNAAVLTFTTPLPPIINTQPANQNIYVGTSTNLSVSVTLTGTTTYQWQKSTDNGVTFTNLTGATSSSFYIYSSQASHSGQYRVIVTNPGGSTTSNAATVTVTIPPVPVITTQPLSRSVYLGDSIYFSVGSSNTGQTTYQWQKSTDNGVTFTSILNATSSYYSIYSAQASDAAQYRVIVTNAGGSTTSNVATVTFLTPTPPVITTQPTSQSVYLGVSVNFGVSASSNGATTYQWQKSTDNGVTFTNILYATSSYYNIYSSQTSDAGQYRVVITNPGGSTTSNVVTLNFLTALPPVISAQPTSQSIYLGAPIYLSVTASITGTTTYQWQKSADNGVTFTNITGATSSSFNLSPSQSSDAGQYRVIVTNPGGSTTSNAAIITVNIPPAPVITTQPLSQSVYPGESIYFSVVAALTGPTSYRWQKSTNNGVNFVDIPGATSSSFNIYTSQASNAGQYRVIVTNPGGSTTSNTATVTISTPPLPVITTQPVNRSIYIGEMISLSIGASSFGTTTYQWQKSTDTGVTFTNIVYATSSSLSIYTSQASDAGQYRVIVTNAGGSATSNAATVTVSMPPPPVITTQPLSQSVYLGASINLSVSSSNTGSTTYQWQKSLNNGVTFTNIQYATSSSFSIYTSQASDAGQYRVIVTNAGGSTISNAATVTVNPPLPPTFTTQPTDATLLEGSAINLYSYATSTSSITYQWYKDNVALSGSTSPTFSKTNTVAADGGKYKLAAANVSGTTYSREATIIVTPPTLPVFVIQPQSQAAYAGDNVTFTASATALPSPTYQWYKNGTAISSATANTLTVSNLSQANDGEAYTLKATNSAGTTTSNIARLTIYASDSGKALGLAPSTRIVGCGRVVYPLTIRSNTDWTVTKSANWISPSYSIGKYNRTLEITVAPNPLPIERTATITIGQQTHTLTQRAAGTPISELWATGANDLGQLGDYRLPPIYYPAKADTSVQAIAAGMNHTLYVKTDGTLWATGYNYYGQLGDGSYTNQAFPVQVATNVKAVAAGYYHSAFLKQDGTLWTVGFNFYGQLGDGTTTGTRNSPVQVATDVASVATGSYQTFFVKTDGKLFAMGYNNYGQLGDGTAIDRKTPVQIATGVVAVASGFGHTLFVKTDGTLWSTGYNSSGQLGDGTTTNRSTPDQIATGVKTVACGNYHSLILKTDGTLLAMGYNYYGQLGDGTMTSRYTPVTISTSVKSMAGGKYHSLFAKTDGTLWAMGDSIYYKLGNGATTPQSLPVLIDSSAQAVACGENHTLFIKTDGSFWAVGSNSKGQLGYASPGIETRATPVCIASEILSAAAGDNHSLYIKTDGSCWSVGDNSGGQLGDGTTITRCEPAQIATGIKAVTTGYNHSLFLKTDGVLLTAGVNAYGQLGDGTSLMLRATPNQIATAIASTSAGAAHSLLLKTDGTLWATGNNYSGQLGTGIPISHSSPLQVVSGVTSTASGGSHSLFIKTEGTLWATGYNNYGQLGNSSTTTQYSPIQVAGSYVAASAGQNHSLFVKSDRTAWSTGYNFYGQLGDSTNTVPSTPVQVLTGVEAVAAGQNHSFWLKTDHTLWAAGDGSSGQLGNGSYNLQRPTPTAIASNILNVFAGSTHSLFLASGDIRYPQVACTITSFSPSLVSAGATITINGTNFANVLAVYFNGTEATSFSTRSPTQITAVAPANITEGKLVVSTMDGVATSSSSYTVGSSSSSSSSSSGSSSSSSSGGGGGAPELWYFAAIGAASLARFAAVFARRR